MVLCRTSTYSVHGAKEVAGDECCAQVKIWGLTSILTNDETWSEGETEPSPHSSPAV